MGLVKGGGSPKRRGKPIGPYDPVKFDAELDEAIATVRCKGGTRMASRFKEFSGCVRAFQAF